MTLVDQVLTNVEGVEQGEPQNPGNRPVLNTTPENSYQVLQAAKEAGFDYLANLTAVDWPDGRPGDDDGTPVFQVVYHLYSIDHNEWLVVNTYVDRDVATVPSAQPLWSAADWHEREMWDLMGVRFDGHPNLKRIMLPEEWDGHPLRKDYDMSVEQFIYRENGEDRVTKDPTRGY